VPQSLLARADEVIEWYGRGGGPGLPHGSSPWPECPRGYSRGRL